MSKIVRATGFVQEWQTQTDPRIDSRTLAGTFPVHVGFVGVVAGMTNKQANLRSIPDSMHLKVLGQ
jgi:hypothetical protein